MACSRPIRTSDPKRYDERQTLFPDMCRQLAGTQDPGQRPTAGFAAIIEGFTIARGQASRRTPQDHYAVGAGTLREALQLLVTDALVVAQGQRGFRVAPISLDDFGDITRTRVLLETVACRQSIECGDDAWEAANVVARSHMLSRAEQAKLDQGAEGSREEWELRNRAFHEVLISASPRAGASTSRTSFTSQSGATGACPVPPADLQPRRPCRTSGHCRCRAGPRRAMGATVDPDRTHPAHPRSRRRMPPKLFLTPPA